MKDDSFSRAVNWFELDRLVDGQLNQAEYRELLRQIEKDPDGWRQCAMAFLQHQALQQELQTIASDPSHPLSAAFAQSGIALSPESKTADKEIPGMLNRTTRLLGGVAVALLIGVTLGMVMRPAEPGLSQGGGGLRALRNAARAAQRDGAARLAIDTPQKEDFTIAELTPQTYGPKRVSASFVQSLDDSVGQDPSLHRRCKKKPPFPE